MTLVQLDGLLHGAVPKPAEAGELSFFTLYTEWAWAAERAVGCARRREKAQVGVNVCTPRRFEP